MMFCDLSKIKMGGRGSGSWPRMATGRRRAGGSFDSPLSPRPAACEGEALPDLFDAIRGEHDAPYQAEVELGDTPIGAAVEPSARR